MILQKLKNLRNWFGFVEEKLNSIQSEVKSITHSNYYKPSYAQHGEDVLLLNLFQDVLGIKKTSYIDIGAHHPFEISNTAIFYANGCNGCNIEANPVLFKNFQVYRPHDINICCGVSDITGEMPFYMIDETSGRNSFDKTLLEKYIKKEPEHAIQEVKTIPCRTLNDIFEKELKNKIPDYMSIDIEGLEYRVLKTFNLEKYAPKIITLEINRDNISMTSSILELLEKSNYFLYLKIHSNYTFVQKNIMTLFTSKFLYTTGRLAV